MPASGSGASARYPLAGEPDRMSAAGLRARIVSSGAFPGSTSEYTPSSRTRRAISCVYWEPKSRIRTGARGIDSRASARTASEHAGKRGQHNGQHEAQQHAAAVVRERRTRCELDDAEVEGAAGFVPRRPVPEPTQEAEREQYDRHRVGGE